MKIQMFEKIRGELRIFRRLDIAVQLLLVSQMLFNVGFYLVVPFLAGYMTDSLAASGAMVGFVLGVRTFSQQGLFFVGGSLADWFGVKPVLLVGVAIRIMGFIIAGFAPSVWWLLFGVVLIGFAAALFSPAAESAFAAAGLVAEKAGVMSRKELFALDALFSRIGSLTGPIIGAVLIPFGFKVVCLVGALVFAIVWVAHVVWVPAVATPPSTSPFAGLHQVVRNKRFLLFAAAYSTGLVAYNQQYLSLPAELVRATGSQAALGWMFVFSSVFVLALQMPIARFAAARRASWSTGVGFVLMGVGFAVVMVAAPWPVSGVWAFVPSLLMLMFLHSGQMLALPTARDTVGVLAGEQNLGAYYGFLNSAGGAAVLVSSVVVGRLLDAAEVPGWAASAPWALLSVLLFVSAWALPRVMTAGAARKVSR